jgi:phosphoserine aminotransferase
MKKYNFYAGPAILPPTVLQQAQEAIKDFEGTGLSILEISHRSKEFVRVMDQARALVKELMRLGSDYEVLFLQNGALAQFHMVPMNLLNEDETAAYFDTGAWAYGALEEAKLFGNVYTACSSRDANYSYIPATFTLPEAVKYLHVTSNNTIYGTQLQFPLTKPWSANVPLVCDMSSDIFSREIDYSQFDLIYAGAQKNMGPAGTVLVVVKKSMLGTVRRNIPKMLDYRQHIDKESMLNTPSVFSVYVAFLTLLWIKQQGIEQLELQNKHKANLLYDAIDNSKVFEGTVAHNSRSLMNVCFGVSKDIPNRSEVEKRFALFAEQHGFIGLPGHRSVGGFRASIYNAMEVEGVKALVQCIGTFAERL